MSETFQKLPASIRGKAITTFEQIGWRIGDVEEAINAAKANALVPLGAEVQFHTDNGIYEAYWLDVPDTQRSQNEQWTDFVDRCANIFLNDFHLLCRSTDFLRVARKSGFCAGSLTDPADPMDALVFQIDFLTEREFCDFEQREAEFKRKRDREFLTYAVTTACTGVLFFLFLWLIPALIHDRTIPVFRAIEQRQSELFVPGH